VQDSFLEMPTGTACLRGFLHLVDRRLSVRQHTTVMVIVDLLPSLYGGCCLNTGAEIVGGPVCLWLQFIVAQALGLCIGCCVVAEKCLSHCCSVCGAYWGRSCLAVVTCVVCTGSCIVMIV